MLTHRDNKPLFLESHIEIEKVFEQNNVQRPFLCCGKSFEKSYVFEYIKQFNPVVFDNIRPNPRFDDMLTAAELFKAEKCDFMIAAGGGSPMDSAKMIRILTNNDEETALYGDIENNYIKALFIPTTAGTGSEATKTSVFYLNEVHKYSVHSFDFIPEYVLFDEKLLETLPLYQRKATCLDALCHSIESYWSSEANDKSREYAAKSIKLFFENKDGYINNAPEGNRGMLWASYYGGKAINLTGTVAPHALCYNITMNCHTAHGHSVAVLLSKIYEYMLERDYPKELFNSFAKVMGGNEAKDGLEIFNSVLEEFKLEQPKIDEAKLDEFVKEVNITKLKTNPVQLNENDIKEIYRRTLCSK
ncbi:MAG: iron-containing alcohol dehydrogenase [Eubacterium sp.]|nr:iron-containing alcohol dehydrogenase [Eubacterium sp.]